MVKSVQKITFSPSRDILLNRLVLSQSNVCRIKAGVSIEELAEDIARRTLLQSLTVRHVLDDDGTETGMFEVPAGGRRFRALELLVKQKRVAQTALGDGFGDSGVIEPASSLGPTRSERNRRRPDTKRPWPILRRRLNMRSFWQNRRKSRRSSKGAGVTLEGAPPPAGLLRVGD